MYLNRATPKQFRTCSLNIEKRFEDFKSWFFGSWRKISEDPKMVCCGAFYRKICTGTILWGNNITVTSILLTDFGDGIWWLFKCNKSVTNMLNLSSTFDVSYILRSHRRSISFYKNNGDRLLAIVLTTERFQNRHSNTSKSNTPKDSSKWKVQITIKQFQNLILTLRIFNIMQMTRRY